MLQFLFNENYKINEIMNKKIKKFFFNIYFIIFFCFKIFLKTNFNN